MVSRWLSGVLALEAAILLVATAFLVGGGRLTALSLLVAGALLVMLNICTIVAAYAFARLYAAFPSDGPRHSRGWRCTFQELLALFIAFVVIQPFERLWMGGDSVGQLAQGREPILLVHGYLCNRGLWWRFRRYLRARHYAVATINLEPPLTSIDRLAVQLGARIDALLAETGAEKVALVTHSMGGLAARVYLLEHGAARVARLVTLAAPHHGTRIARLGCGRNAREMRRGSEWLQRLNVSAPPETPVASLWSPDDEIVVPPDSGRLPNARETVLDEIGHIAIALSPTVFAKVEAELTRATS